jgi:hypothetical protein
VEVVFPAFLGGSRQSTAHTNDRRDAPIIDIRKSENKNILVAFLEILATASSGLNRPAMMALPRGDAMALVGPRGLLIRSRDRLPACQLGDLSALGNGCYG